MWKTMEYSIKRQKNACALGVFKDGYRSHKHSNCTQAVNNDVDNLFVNVVNSEAPFVILPLKLPKLASSPTRPWLSPRSGGRYATSACHALVVPVLQHLPAFPPLAASPKLQNVG